VSSGFVRPPARRPDLTRDAWEALPPLSYPGAAWGTPEPGFYRYAVVEEGTVHIEEGVLAAEGEVG